jgi:beta-lactam-binding protein with PASTA domain
VRNNKSSEFTNSAFYSGNIFVLVYTLLMLVFNLPIYGQQPENGIRRSQAIQQPARTYRIPENLLQIQMVSVPPLVGRYYNPDEISALLIKAGLRLGNAVPVVNNEKVGVIISQSPELRQRVRPQTPVDITYGVADQPIPPGLPENVIVPNYIGMNIEQVLGRLPNDRLTSGAIEEITSEQPTGEVIEQFPLAGSNVDPNTSVGFKLSSGPQQVTIDVPRLIGLSLQEAAEELKRNQLFAGLLKMEVSDKREGEVLDQFPREGTAVPLGSAVDVTYSVLVREESEIVPNVIGMDLKDAQIILDEIGFPIEQVYYENSKTKEGTVIKQQPTPGEKVKKGTPVTLIFARQSYPPWIYWGGGIVAALLLGGYMGWKSGKGKRERSEKKEPEIEIKIIPDAGKQTFHFIHSGQSLEGLHFEIIPDKGVQTLKTN